jgi:pimeloyl-ACP methyl ester carboxylesterase
MTASYATTAGGRAVEQRYREMLRLWPVPSKQLSIPTREGNTFVVACGPTGAPPLLLLHGSAANTAMWMGDVASWAQHFRVYAVDMVGEPGFSAPSRPPLASEAYALWLDDVLSELAAPRVSIVGVSLGAWLALDYAIRRPDRVGRPALLCPGGIGRQKWGVVFAALLLMPFGRWGLHTTMRLALGGALPADTPQDREFADYLMLIHKHFRPRRERLPMFDDDALRQLRIPVMVIVGGRDRMLDSFDTRRRLERAVPHATVRLLPNAGHLLLGQSGVVLDFLRSDVTDHAQLPQAQRPNLSQDA